MEEWEADGDSQAEVIAKFMMGKLLPCGECGSNEGRLFPCDYDHCIHGICNKCRHGLFCMNNLDPSIIECPCCSDEQIIFPDGKVPWYYRSFPIALTLGWLSTLLPPERGSHVRAAAIEGMTRTFYPDFYDIKIPEGFDD